jgi:hypothetical protein
MPRQNSHHTAHAHELEAAQALLLLSRSAVVFALPFTSLETQNGPDPYATATDDGIFRRGGPGYRSQHTKTVPITSMCTTVDLRTAEKRASQNHGGISHSVPITALVIVDESKACDGKIGERRRKKKRKWDGEVAARRNKKLRKMERGIKKAREVEKVIRVEDSSEEVREVGEQDEDDDSDLKVEISFSDVDEMELD